MYIPLIFLKLRKLKIIHISLLFFTSLILFSFQIRGLIFTSNFLDPLFRSILGICSGFCLFLIYEKFKINKFLTKKILLNFLTIFFLTLTLLIIALSNIHQNLLLFMPTFACIVIVLGTNSQTFLSNSILQFLGKRSYTIYMLHMPIIPIIVNLFGEEIVNGNILIKSASIIFTIFLSDLIYRFIELPCSMYGRNLFKNQKFNY